jgi:hypothetical protein
VICQLAPCRQRVVACWWFAVCFSILKGHFTLGVAHWLRRWTLWSTTCPTSGSGLSPAHCQPFCLSSICLMKVCAEITSLPNPLLWFTFRVSALSAVCWFFPGGWENNAWCLSVWSAVCLPSRFGAGVRWQQPSCFLSVMWCGDAFYGLGFRESKFWLSLVFYFLQVWLQHLRKVFNSWSSCCLLLYSSCHLRSSLVNLFYKENVLEALQWYSFYC